jgi:hypothetical protein
MGYRKALLLSFAAGVALAACSGGGGGSSAPVVPNAGSGSAVPQSNYVTPKFSFVLPGHGSTSTSSSSRTPQYVSPNSTTVTITLESNSVGLGQVSATTDLTKAGVCSGTPYTCTVNGPPVPPGTDQFDVQVSGTASQSYAKPALMQVTPSPVLLSQSSTSASPAQPDPTFTIAPGSSGTILITLYGVPGIIVITPVTPPNNTLVPRSPRSRSAHPLSAPDPGEFVADTASSEPVPITVEDPSGYPITGEFASPVNVQDNDAAGGSAAPGQYATYLYFSSSGDPGVGSRVLSQTLNSDTDEANLEMGYGGLDELSPTLTATAASAVPAFRITPYQVVTQPIVLNPSEVDLYAGGPNAQTITVSEAGWTDAPYNQALTAGTATCSNGTAANTYALTFPSTTSWTDTTPASAAAGDCTVPVTNTYGAGGETDLTLTYTTSGIGVNGRARKP